MGLSPAHLRRVFKRATGVSPKRYALARLEMRLKEDLRAGERVAPALYAAGYGSSASLYAHTGLGMSPTAYRRGGEGVQLTFARFTTPLGEVLLATSEAGVVALRFSDPEALFEELRLEFPAAALHEDAAALKGYSLEVCAFLEGRAKTLDLTLEPRATDFQRRVWAALQTIPYGETRSYREVAEMIGQPGVVRTVAQACAANHHPRHPLSPRGARGRRAERLPLGCGAEVGALGARAEGAFSRVCRPTAIRNEGVG